MNDVRGHARMPQGSTNTIAMSIAKFGTLDKVDLSARTVDSSPAGVGVECDVPLEPGFVWFREGAGQHKYGVVVWARACDDHTWRAGIQFISVQPSREDTKQPADPQLYPSFSQAPGLVTSMLVDEVLILRGEA